MHTNKTIKLLAQGLNNIAALSLLAMVILVCLDVLLRIIGSPIIGTYEIIRFLETAVISLAMADTALKRGHIAVEIVTERLPYKIKLLTFIIVELGGIILFALLGWECISYGNNLRNAGEVSLTLEIPFYPILYGISFSSFAVSLVLLLNLYKVLTGRSGPWP